DQARDDFLGPQVAWDNGEITARDRMGAELLPQPLFGGEGAGENHQAAGAFVEAMHDTQAGQRSLAPPILSLCDEPRHQIFEGWLQGLALCRPVTLGRMSHGRHSSRLLDDDQVPIDVTKDDLVASSQNRAGCRTQFDNLPLFELARGIEAKL